MLDVWRAWMYLENLPREEEPLGRQSDRGPVAVLRLAQLRGRGQGRFQGPTEDGSTNAARDHAAGLHEDAHLQPLQELRKTGRPRIIIIIIASGLIKSGSSNCYYYYAASQAHRR